MLHGVITRRTSSARALSVRLCQPAGAGACTWPQRDSPPCTLLVRLQRAILAPLLPRRHHPLLSPSPPAPSGPTCSPPKPSRILSALIGGWPRLSKRNNVPRPCISVRDAPGEMCTSSSSLVPRRWKASLHPMRRSAMLLHSLSPWLRSIAPLEYIQHVCSPRPSLHL